MPDAKMPTPLAAVDTRQGAESMKSGPSILEHGSRYCSHTAHARYPDSLLMQPPMRLVMCNLMAIAGCSEVGLHGDQAGGKSPGHHLAQSLSRCPAE